MPRLKDEQTTMVEIAPPLIGVRVQNITDKQIKVYIDWHNGQVWSALTGERTVAVGATFDRTREELGHQQVRVGVRGPEDGRDIADVTTY